MEIGEHLKQRRSGDLKPESAIMHIMNVVSYCLEQPELCDEMYCQLIRQTNNNPEVEAQLRGCKYCGFNAEF